LAESAGVEILLVGDSLGMVIQGHDTTLKVSLEQVVYHTKAVAQGADRALILADLPFGSYQLNKEQAYLSSVALMQAGAQMVKLEGGADWADTIRFLNDRGIPVCAHIGLMPQSVHALGGFFVQGKTEAAAAKLYHDAKVLEAAGARLLVLECVPSSVAKTLAAQLTIPVIGIGAGVDVDGQVLVLHDMLGIYAKKSPKFSHNFMSDPGVHSIQAALEAYVNAVKTTQFPTSEHSF
jgi:3-methyl-2-oxobutanoate hydroxymethyltransferase